MPNSRYCAKGATGGLLCNDMRRRLGGERRNGLGGRAERPWQCRRFDQLDPFTDRVLPVELFRGLLYR